MKNTLRLYSGDLADGPTFVLVPDAIGAVTLLIGILMLSPFSIASVYLISIAVMLIGINHILHGTSIYRGMTRSHYNLLSIYRSLPEDIKKQIYLSVETVKSMTSDEAVSARYELNDLAVEYRNLQKERGKFDGPAYAFRQKTRELRNGYESDLEFVRERNYQIERMSKE